MSEWKNIGSNKIGIFDDTKEDAKKREQHFNKVIRKLEQRRKMLTKDRFEKDREKELDKIRQQEENLKQAIKANKLWSEEKKAAEKARKKQERKDKRKSA